MSGTPQTWQVVIQKLFGTEYFVNDYHVQATSFAAAKSAADSIVAIERFIHSEQTQFVNYRIKEVGVIQQGTVFPIGQNGLAGLGDWMALYNTVRVDFTVPQGRPGRKYLRLPLQMAAIHAGNLTAAMQNFIKDNYCGPLINLGVVCKSNGQLFTFAAPNPAMQMRQIRRGSKRRLQPII